MLQWSFLYSIYNYVVCKGISIVIPIYYSQRSCWLGRILWQGTLVWLRMTLGQLLFSRVGICVDALPADICTVSDVGSLVIISLKKV
jgi:hypothetical protein